MTPQDTQGAVAHWSVQDMLREYLTTGRMAEVVYRDGAGQVCIAHDIIRDVFSRAGKDFILLGRGEMVGVDHVITIDGKFPTVSCC
ncbi:MULTISPECIES: hypothetical protein [Marinobacter]|uniref:Rho-binding antiterminator n=1 Tax=Marinobacter pelagius TaxID=379482 RepID=A0A1I4UV00_9GAMM|nr:hypothetical protein [Marinobacter pelagius]SFM92781.1 Rho-binding antiterminator [Marinobacter pelagius]